MKRFSQHIRLEDLITSAYEAALSEVSDPEKARELAAAVVTDILVRTGNVHVLESLLVELESGEEGAEARD